MVRYRTRDVEDETFFTNRFQLTNTHESKRHFLLEKNEPDPSVIQSVLVDGKSVPFRVNGDLIQFEAEVDSGQTMKVVIEDCRQPIPKHKGAGVSYRVGTFIRRELSEFRDNTLSKCPGVLGAAKKVAKGLKLT